MAVLVSDIINLAFQNAGVINPGVGLSANMLADGFTRLNMLLDAASSIKDMCNAQYHQAFTLTSSLSTYTVGTGGSLVSTVNPVRIYAASSTITGIRQAIPVISFEEFEKKISDNNGLTASLPSIIAVDNAFPAQNIKVFPTPGNTPGTLTLSYWGAISQFVDTTVVVTMASGWQDYLHFKLAVALYPQYRRQVGIPPELATQAENAMLNIINLNKSINSPNPTPAPPPQ